MNNSLINDYKKQSLLNSTFYKTLLEELDKKEIEILKLYDYEELIELLQTLINNKCVQKTDYFK